MNGKGGGSPCRRVRDSFFLYSVCHKCTGVAYLFCDFDILTSKIKALRRGLFQMFNIRNFATN